MPLAEAAPPGAVDAYIGLGSNLNDPAAQLRNALKALAQLPWSELTECSRFYRNRPMGPQDQPDYVNAVAHLRTALGPLALLDELQAIEQRQGRVRTRRWGPRSLDLDLLLYGGLRLDSDRLTLPHPGLRHRDFVLCPLFEIAPPELTLPGGESLAELVGECAGLEPL